MTADGKGVGMVTVTYALVERDEVLALLMSRGVL